ncbi:MAG: hypothetical protein JSV22_00215 [Bacteroidales bacterium]|nr:MAG: hypothetical protein JSV22_00215 [Bacteroidales bacterium]
MTLILKKINQLIVGLIFLYGIYIITHGHLTPGGCFAVGAVIAGAFFLLVLAYGSDILKLRKREEGSSVAESTGIFIFLVLAFTALIIVTRIFFTNYLPKGITGELISSGVIPLYNIAVGIEVAAALFNTFLALYL